MIVEVPGHDGASSSTATTAERPIVVSGRADVIEFRDMVIAVKAKVSALVAEGGSYDDVVAAGPTAEYEATWGDPERFLTAVYAELAGD